jgi:hypothetical protein
MSVTPVAGYTEQTPEALAQVNKNKQLEERILRQLDELRNDSVKYDQRWLAVARTHFEQAFMALNRSIFQPQRIKLDGDDTD